MENLRFTIDTVTESGSRLSMDIPDKMLGRFEINSYGLQGDISRRNGIISVSDSGAGVRYSFDLGRAGSATGRDQLLQTAVALIKTAQATALITTYDCADAYVSLAPIVGGHLKIAGRKLPLNVVLPSDVLKLVDTDPAVRVMRDVYEDLLDPYGDSLSSRGKVGIDLDPDNGLSMWLGSSQTEMISSRNYDRSAASVVLGGEVSGHAQQLVLMAGAISLGRTVEQLESA